MAPSSGPTILGIDIVMVASALSAIAPLRIIAIYAARPCTTDDQTGAGAADVASISRPARRLDPNRRMHHASRESPIASATSCRRSDVQDEHPQGAAEAASGLRSKSLPRFHLRSLSCLWCSARLRYMVYFRRFLPDLGAVQKYGCPAPLLLATIRRLTQNASDGRCIRKACPTRSTCWYLAGPCSPSRSSTGRREWQGLSRDLRAF